MSIFDRSFREAACASKSGDGGSTTNSNPKTFHKSSVGLEDAVMREDHQSFRPTKADNRFFNFSMLCHVSTLHVFQDDQCDVDAGWKKAVFHERKLRRISSHQK